MLRENSTWVLRLYVTRQRAPTWLYLVDVVVVIVLSGHQFLEIYQQKETLKKLCFVSESSRQCVHYYIENMFLLTRLLSLCSRMCHCLSGERAYLRYSKLESNNYIVYATYKNCIYMYLKLSQSKQVGE